MDSLTISLVQDIIRREGRSLLHYVRDSFPWATPEEQTALSQITEIIDAEQAASAGLARFILKHHQPLPYIGTCPMGFTDINYVSLDHLTPLLIKHQKRSIAQLERDLALLHDKDAKDQVQKLLAMKESHLHQLEKLAAPKPAATAAT